MEKITYGAPGLVDWVAQIKVGGATVRVHFTGGALTSYGVTPAEYTTSNAFMQKVIENSSYFKDGRITEVRRAAVEEPQRAEPKGNANRTDLSPTLDAWEGDARGGTPLHSIGGEAGEAGSAGVTKVAVTCLPDAQAYLQENFNISSYKVRSCEIAQKIAGEHGIQFTGGKFDTLSGERSVESGEEE